MFFKKINKSWESIRRVGKKWKMDERERREDPWGARAVFMMLEGRIDAKCP